MKRCELCRCRATSYCEADRAYLCWDCDAKVHGANFLVARHDRCLLCRACQSFTPWRASGSAWLGHASSLCAACSSTDKAPSLVGCGASSMEVTDLGSPPSCCDETSSSLSSSSSFSCASSAGAARGRRQKRCRDGNNNRSSTQRVGREREAARNIDSSLKRRKKNGHPADRTD